MRIFNCASRQGAKHMFHIRVTNFEINSPGSHVANSNIFGHARIFFVYDNKVY